MRHITKSKLRWMMAAVVIGSASAFASGGWAQQSGGAPAGGGGATSADHDAAGHGGAMDHGAMGHGMGGMGGMGGMMGQGGGMEHGASGGKGAHGGMMMGHMMCRTTEHVEGRLAYLKTELKITDAQTPQWNAFSEAVRTATQKAGQFCESMHEHGGSGMSGSGMSGMSGGVIAQLGMMERMMTAHLDEVRTVKAAAEPLFNVLSDEQKKTADQTMSGMMGFGMGMGGGMGAMGGMGKM